MAVCSICAGCGCGVLVKRLTTQHRHVSCFDKPAQLAEPIQL